MALRKNATKKKKDNENLARDNYLSKVYFDESAPGSYTGLQKLWLSVKDDPERPRNLTKKTVKEWLQKQEVYQVHSVPKEKYKTEAIIVGQPDEIWDLDILILPDQPGQNGNSKKKKYLLGCIDIFTRFVRVRLMKTKTAAETAKAFKSILSEGKKCQALRGDNGPEFKGAPFRKILKEEKIPYITAYGHVKANYIERWFKTFQQKLHRYSYHNNKLHFVDVINEIVHSYNNTIHGTTGFRPAEVGDHNALELYDRVYKPILDKRAEEKVKPSFRVGDLVRISLFKDKFKRSYTQNWSEEVFEIWSVVKSHPERFKIRDLLKEKVLGSFYSENLKLVNASEVNEVNWKIDRVISTRKLKGKKQESLVSWFGYSNKFNSYVNTSDLKKYPRIR